MFRVAIALYPNMLATSLSLPLEMLQAGYAYARRHVSDAPKMTIDLLGELDKEVHSHSGLRFNASLSTEQIQQCDLVIFPSLWRNPRPTLRQQQALVDALSGVSLKQTSVIGVGTGNCFLAQAGLLDGHPATTHWHYAEQFRRDYPLVKLKPEYFITQAEGIYSVASLNALADVIVHILENLYGTQCAQHVQRNFSHEIRKPYEQQRYLEGNNERHPDELIAQIQFWIKNNPSEAISLPKVAQEFDISTRSLSRRFKEATGMTVHQYWRKIKVQSAQELLTQSNLSVQDIAIALGFNHQGSLNRLFKQSLEQSPSEYRTLVRKKLFGADSN